MKNLFVIPSFPPFLSHEHEALVCEDCEWLTHSRNSLRWAKTMLDLLRLLDLQKLRHAQLVAKLASLTQTMLGLLDLRKLRLTRSLARTEPCLICGDCGRLTRSRSSLCSLRPCLGLRDLRRLRLIRSPVEPASFACTH